MSSHRDEVLHREAYRYDELVSFVAGQQFRLCSHCGEPSGTTIPGLACRVCRTPCSPAPDTGQIADATAFIRERYGMRPSVQKIQGKRVNK